MHTSLRIPALAASGALLLGVGVAAAGDESKDVAVRIQANLEAASCTATPPTVTLLGATIEVTNAKFEIGDESDDDDDDGPSIPGACSGLVLGALTEAKLVDDQDPLTALKVEQGEDDDHDGTELQAPLQEIDPASGQITLLGLKIDASTAALDGAGDDCDDHDDDDDDSEPPLDLGQLVPGQFVEVRLDEAKLPALVATRLEVKNFDNQIEVDLEDEHGEDIDDDSPTVAVNAAVTVLVRVPTGKGKATRTVRQTVHLNQSASGRFILRGLPKGLARIQITREVGGTKWAARRNLKVVPNTTRTVRVRLHKTRAR
jgi:hypothetical protein